jgi:hypothetical protein
MLKEAQVMNPQSVEIMLRLGTISYIYEDVQPNSEKELWL